jgi:hypothetical protein
MINYDKREKNINKHCGIGPSGIRNNSFSSGDIRDATAGFPGFSVALDSPKNGRGIPTSKRQGEAKHKYLNNTIIIACNHCQVVPVSELCIQYVDLKPPPYGLGNLI